MSSKSLVKFFFDINSPYSYVGFELLSRLCSAHSSSLAVQWTPVRIPAIFKKLKATSPFFVVPQKTAHLERDLRRQCDYYDIEMRVPEAAHLSAFLKAGNTVAAQRLIVAAGEDEDVELPPLIRALFARMWRDHLPMNEDGHLDEVFIKYFLFQQLKKKVGPREARPSLVPNSLLNRLKFVISHVLSSLHLPPSTISSLIAKSKTAEVKQRFIDNTQEVIDDGAFGLPWMNVYRPNESAHESFFGSDRFHLIEKHLGL
ncbi:hypothetical protein PRIPAC_82028 [Pristionchus pacificus]|uniref:DSBA domain-containing protein n=1 Tax=Pristionchus pacificus TaxID=54126 RepID=A0A2A6BI38_PRIPA|nr:hypothetical protein PRIPAC_82028 [Pristionchus pacificus]|eukprot:PDM65564.1 hypothetical protein PRIPAC_52506 [Pristionchus pacificus]